MSVTEWIPWSSHGMTTVLKGMLARHWFAWYS